MVMRINRFIANATGMSRRAADRAILEGKVSVNGQPAAAGHKIIDGDTVTLDNQPLRPTPTQTIILNKPRGYVCSRNGQGSKTIYDLLPNNLYHLKPVGRLDKDSSGLLLLTNNGTLAQQLTHPGYRKNKRYEIILDQPLQPLHRQMISDFGLQLDDGPSKLLLERHQEGNDQAWTVIMHEGRNRQIRRTFAALGYTVTGLHRTHFGPYSLGKISSGDYRLISE